MGIVRGQEDSYVKEMAKWEGRPVFVNGSYIEPIPFADGGRGGAPRLEYPKMLYQAESADGGPRISGYKIVQDETGERLAIGSGYAVTQEEALANVDARMLALARAAAERAHNDRWMSDKARAEAQVVDEATMQHLGEIPATPINRRGRKAKQTGVA